MTDLLGIGAAGIRAYRTALAVVGDNVANADSPGYTRRMVTLKAAPRAGGGGPLSLGIQTGAGVDAGSIGRAYDGLKASAARNAGSDVARLDTRGDWLDRLQTVVGGASGQLNTALGDFYDGALAVVANPLSTAARTIFLDRADQAASGFRDTAAGIAGLARDIAATTATATREVNGLTGALARVNDELRRAGGRDTAALLDERDRLLGSLGTYLRVGVGEGPNGVVTVTLGDAPNAPALVTGGEAVRVGVRDGPNGAELVLDPTHEARAVRLPASGSLAGLIEAARAIRTAAQTIDGLATRFADAVDAAQTGGVDRAGADGTPLFARVTLAVTSGAANAGTATIEVAIADGAGLDPQGYVLTRDAGQWTLARRDGSGAVSGPGPLTLDGATVSASPGARDGDGYTLDVATGAAGLRLRALAPGQLAVSSRWLGDAAASNAGTGTLAVTLAAGAAGLPALPAYTIRMIDAANAEIVDPATATVLATVPVAGGPVAGAGFTFALTGVPVAGDSFRILRAPANSADTGNFRTLLATRNGAAVEDGLDAAVAGIASQVSETGRLADAAAAVAEDATRANDQVSGVDLDREAAELTRLQAAYKANAQVIAAARELFDALLEAAR